MTDLQENIKHLQPYAVTIIFVAIYFTEHIYPQRNDLADYKHDAFNILIGILDLSVVGGGGYLLQWCLTHSEAQHWSLLYRLPGYMQIIAGFVMADIFMYWWHRANHSIPALWYFHKFHHKDKKLNASSSVRFHIGELFISYLIKIPLFVLLGITANTVIIYGLVLLPVITLHHSNIRISYKADMFLRKLLVSPRMHRIHHSVIKTETNSNYSSVFPYWDIIFGSYKKLPEREIEFGL